jgi:predicted P-loop ATPase
VHFEHDGDFPAAVRAYAKEVGLKLSPPSSTAVGKASAPASTKPESRFDFEAALIRNRFGHPRWCAENAGLILEHHPDWAGALAFDEFNVQVLLLKRIPGSRAPLARFQPRELTEPDITAALRWFNRNGFPDATRNTLAEAMIEVAHETIISPVRHYLEGLTWDGKPRIGTWLTVYCGVVCTRFVRAAGQAWLISAVARALDPGCKADCALIFEGPQGAGKSSALRTLAGPAWFFDGLRDFTSKDAAAGLRGKWIIELPELAAMRRSDNEAAKAFMSRCVERYRPAYGRVEVSEPRRCVFAGTTNRSDYLTDDTGARRYWPVAIGAIDIDALARDRDQLWGETVQLYRDDVPWWLSDEAEADAAREASLRTEDDPWTSKVLHWVQGRTEVSTKEVLVDPLQVIEGQATKADAMRVAGILQRHGWRREGKFSSGSNRGLARYVPGPREA